jgi:lipopolysaccharide/colanic/teichoic acid biosynthesis glycosyltransferase
MRVRRIGDVILGLVLLLACLPAFAFATLAVWLDAAAMPFERQERITRGGRRVSVFRLRTSRQTRFGPRDTVLGAFLRRWHLDEIPQLLNVLTGELSLIGGQPGFIDELGGKKAFVLRDP